jgi:hypothetical protein
MRTRTAVLLALASLLAPAMGHADDGRKFDDIVELSPDLYLLMYTSRVDTYVGLRLDAIRRANDFAASKGGVAVPVMGRQSALGVALKLYEYQFRVMTADQARAAQPVLADAVITVNNMGQCASNAAIAALGAVPADDELRVVGGPLGLPGMHSASTTMSADDSADDPPGAICLPGQLCRPSQLCLPGWQCSPGAPPVPETAPPAG